ncbi:hypothetical protein M2480_000177 [Parabacteroides sp. PFB2-12]|uniref:hypothetical protein n=1 Tax=unclassified Parabacteroides TaxID=2649774 RepID=UPI002474C4E1|nr:MULTISPECIES: hypothetical protein [unclassified Parabacteroides]MDH6341425.1 hypothetical protein [Parabacteroides sp. PM6-13]MDH6389219.1 hypothetical protein [Parabacteroides sp. PFB2-12]
MKTLIVDIDTNGNADAIADALRLMRGVKNVFISEDTPRRMTVEEYREMAAQAITAARQGDVISQEDLEKEMTKW